MANISYQINERKRAGTPGTDTEQDRKGHKDRFFNSKANVCLRGLCVLVVQIVFAFVLFPPFSSQHKFIAFGIDTHGQVGWFISFGLRFPGQLAAGYYHFMCTGDHVRHLKT
jgi:hypothetical protein